MNLRLREATESDIDAIYSIRLSVTENATTDLAKIPREPLIAAIRAGGSQLCLDADRPVAYALAVLNPSMIWGLYVRPEYQGRGIGKRLLAHTVEWLRLRGARSIWLSTAPGTRAERLYLAQGWRRSGQSAHEVEFTLDLDQPA